MKLCVNVMHEGVVEQLYLYLYILLLLFFAVVSEECFCHLFSLHSMMNRAVFYKVFSALRSAKPIQSLGGVLWSAFWSERQAGALAGLHTV